MSRLPANIGEKMLDLYQIASEFAGIPGSNGWTAKIVEITPDMATSLLLNNGGNRKIRPAVVSKYRRIIEDSGWVTTPEPIIISNTGRLLNGQHRLTAVCLAKVTVGFLVIDGVDDGVFRALDRGAIRSTADALALPKRVVEVARLGADIVKGTPHGTDAEVERVARMIAPAMNLLMDECPSTAKIFSSAAFRLAACLRLMEGNEDYVVSTYRALVLGHIADLSQIAQNAVGNVVAGRLNTHGGGRALQLENLARAWDIFDVSKRDQTRVIIRDLNSKIAKIRNVIVGHMSGQA